MILPLLLFYFTLSIRILNTAREHIIIYRVRQPFFYVDKKKYTKNTQKTILKNRQTYTFDIRYLNIYRYTCLHDSSTLSYYIPSLPDFCCIHYIILVYKYTYLTLILIFIFSSIRNYYKIYVPIFMSLIVF